MSKGRATRKTGGGGGGRSECVSHEKQLQAVVQQQGGDSVDPYSGGILTQSVRLKNYRVEGIYRYIYKVVRGFPYTTHRREGHQNPRGWE